MSCISCIASLTCFWSGEKSDVNYDSNVKRLIPQVGCLCFGQNNFRRKVSDFKDKLEVKLVNQNKATK